MKLAREDQFKVEKGEAGYAEADLPDLSCAAGILVYLSKKTEAFTDIGTSGPWSRRIAFLSVAATCVVAFGGLTCLLLGMRGNPLIQSAVKIAAAIVYGLWVVRFVFWVNRSWLTRTIWRRPTLVRIVERNEAHATSLTTCSESLLRYVKDSLKDHITKVNGRMDSIFSKKGALPIFAGASLIWHNWADIQKYLSGLLDSGSAALIARYGAVPVAVIFGWFLLMRLGIWWSMSNYTFQMEIVATALRMKEVKEDKPDAGVESRSATG